jgi:hypothetical protein
MPKSKELHELTSWLSQNCYGNWEYDAKVIDSEFRCWTIWFNNTPFFEANGDFDTAHAKCVALLQTLKTFHEQS